jgi:hypothetical protein
MKHERTFELVLLVLFVGLFLWGWAAWAGLLPSESVYRPGQFMLLTGAMALQPLSALVRQRSRVLCFALMGLSAAAMCFLLFS